MQADNTVSHQQPDSPRLLVLIPVYNGEQTVGRVIEAVHGVMKSIDIPYQVLAVNDGSTDSTANILNKQNINILSHEKNLGKGSALKNGFRYAFDNRYSHIVTLDADGQHDPEYLPAMVQLSLRHDYDLVIGTRKKNPGTMSSARIFSNAVTSWLISVRTGTKIPDSQSGYRVIKTESLESIKLRTSRYETESEILIRGGKKKWRFGFVPISTIYGNETSHIRHVRDTIRFIIMYFKTIFM